MRTINNKRKHKSSQHQNHSKNHSLTSLAALLLNSVEPILFLLWMMFWFISPIKAIN